jgi:hypothetical protein
MSKFALEHSFLCDIKSHTECSENLTYLKGKQILLQLLFPEENLDKDLTIYVDSFPFKLIFKYVASNDEHVFAIFYNKFKLKLK